MAAFLTLFVGVLLLFAFLAFEFWTINKKAIKYGYGPKLPIRTTPCATGSLVCVSVNAPTLGRSLSFPYAFTLTANDRSVTGSYEYRAKKRAMAETIYSGELFLSFSGDRVKGRALMAGLQSVEGTVDATEAQLTRGQPKASWLSFLNGPFSYSIHQGRVLFQNTERAGCISKDSELRIHGGRVSGRLLHGPQTTWAVEVDVQYRNIADERVALAVILACNDILSVHHGD